MAYWSSVNFSSVSEFIITVEVRMSEIATIANMATILTLIVSLASLIWIVLTKNEVDKIKISIAKQNVSINQGNTTYNMFNNNAPIQLPNK